MNLLLEALADLFEYPRSGWNERLNECRWLARSFLPDRVTPLSGFHRRVEGLPIEELQELYTSTFDLKPVCTMEIGYHLFGDNYKRGVFLANLRKMESPYDLGQDRQLPDYLPVLLRLLARIEHDELRGDLIGQCVVPGMETMFKELDRENNPFADLVAATMMILESDPRDECLVSGMNGRKENV